MDPRSYVPVKVDYTDLYDIMTFFRGTPEGLNAHEELAAKIGLAGKRWARDHVRPFPCSGLTPFYLDLVRRTFANCVVGSLALSMSCSGENKIVSRLPDSLPLFGVDTDFESSRLAVAGEIYLISSLTRGVLAICSWSDCSY